jgi:hypothetical protein
MGTVSVSGLVVGALLLPAAQTGAEPPVVPDAVTRIHVAADAADGGDGSAQRPFAGLAAARDALRVRRAAAGPEGLGTVEVLVGGGDYVLEGSLELTAVDSGVPDAPVTYRVAPGAKARLIGGIVLRDPVLAPVEDATVLRRLPAGPARAHVRMVALPDDRRAAVRGPVPHGMATPVEAIGSEVVVDGRVLTRARWPNAGAGGWRRVDGIVDPGSVPRRRQPDVAATDREAGPLRGGAFRLDSDRLARWAGAEDVWAMGFWRWDWADEQLPVGAIDPAERTISLAAPHWYGLHPEGRFYLTNLLEELDEPGEHFIDAATGTVYLWPHDPAPGELVVTTTGEPLIALDGAAHIVIEGFDLGPTRGAGIRGRDVRAVTISDCRILATGTSAIELNGEGCVVTGNRLTDIGGTGISIDGGDRARLLSGRNVVADNEIRRFGRVLRTYRPGVRIDGVGQLVRHNLLAEAPHSAILLAGNDHRIESNEIFDVLRETGDCGAIYAGRDWTMHGNVIRWNVIHHLRGTDARYQNGVYLDDMASGITVASNLFYECHWGMLVGGGRDVLIRGNVFVGGSLGVRFDARGIGWMASWLADPATSTLHKRLEAVPYREPPWSVRFPMLRSYLTDRFGRPVGSAVVGNAFCGVPLGSIEDRECVRVEGNAVLDDAPFPIRVDERSGRLRFDRPFLEIAPIADFEHIPTGVGPRPHR